MENPIKVSDIDIEHHARIRSSVVSFMKQTATDYGQAPGRLLDIAPQDHDGARPFFGPEIVVETFDVDPNSGCDYIGDLCARNDCLKSESFDHVVCTEVLEHTLRPFDAIDEIFRILKPGGHLFLTVPFNFRIHGPLPDCWRFTEHGLRSILDRFDLIKLESLETEGRALMPIHYTVVARKPACSA
jgi:SAM-dependent methyltransferase